MSLGGPFGFDLADEALVGLIDSMGCGSNPETGRYVVDSQQFWTT